MGKLVSGSGQGTGLNVTGSRMESRLTSTQIVAQVVLLSLFDLQLPPLQSENAVLNPRSPKHGTLQDFRWSREKPHFNVLYLFSRVFQKKIIAQENLDFIDIISLAK